MNSKFNKLFQTITEEFNIDFSSNKPIITPAIIETIINALNYLWQYHYENHLFDSIEPQSPDDEIFDEKQPFQNLTYMQKWDDAITQAENNGSGQLLVSPMHFYNAVVRAITQIDERDKTIYIQPEVEFFADQQDDSMVAEALVNLGNSLGEYIFRIQPEMHEI